VDVVVWICDPQKYADQLVHEGYLRQLAAHRSGLIVALNQTDKLLPAHLPKVGADLRQLLDDGGLGEAQLVATSATSNVPEAPTSKRGPIKPKPGPFSTERAVHGFPGVSTLRALLEPIVQSGRAGMESVDRDVTSVLGQLTALIGGPAAQPAAAPLVEALVARRIDAGISEYATEAGKPLPEAWRSAIKNAATL